MIEALFDTIELFGDLSFPTSCGKQIHFTESLVKATLQIDIAHRDSDDESPIDVLGATLLIPDSDGVVWSVESRATTEFLVEKMVDISSLESSLIPASSAPDEIKNAFLSKSLKNLRYSSDDRFYRQIILGSEIIQFPFQYTTVHFDVAFLHSPIGITDPKITVHVREDSLFCDGESLDAFYYYVDWKGIFRSNTAIYSEDYGCWQDNPLPTPLVFEKTEKTWEANEDVKIS